MIVCGARQIDITPPIGVPLAGYGSRTEGSRGIHDPLLGQVIYLGDRGHEVLLITLDLVAVDGEFTAEVRKEINAAAGIAAEAVLVSCTHTHSGPDGYSNTFPREAVTINEPLRRNTIEKLAGAASWAKETARPAHLSLWSEPLTGIGMNRNDPLTPVDNELTVLRIDIQGAAAAVLVNYGCHPTVMGADNLLISADIPGAARHYFNALYPDAVMLYTNGGSGDVSTRFSRRSQSFDELERFGLILYSAIISCMQKAQPLNTPIIRGASWTVDLPLRIFPPLSQAQQMLDQYRQEYETYKLNRAELPDLRKMETKIMGAETQLRLSKTLKHQSAIASEIQAFNLGGLLVVTIPGEPFAGITRGIKAAFPDQHVIVVSYANDYKGYFTIDEPDQTYETLKSPWPSEIGQFLISMCTDSLKKFQASTDLKNNG